MRELGHLAPLAGRGRIVLTIRVRGILRESEFNESPPHPDPLPASGAREQCSIAAAPLSKLGHALAVVEQHPADGRKADEDGHRDRPSADADVAGGLPRALVLGDLAIARLGILVRVAHRLIPHHGIELHGCSRHILDHDPAGVDGCRGCKSAVIDAARPAVALPVPPMPASRLSENAASAAHKAAAAAATNTAPVLHFIVSKAPPTNGPTIEPTRPIPSAQPTPEALTEVG